MSIQAWKKKIHPYLLEAYNAFFPKASKDKSRANLIGCLSILIAALTPTFTLGLKRIPPCQSAFFIFSFSSLFHLLCYKFEKSRFKMHGSKEGLSFYLLLVGFLGVSGSHFCYIYAFQYIPAEEVEIIYYFWPLIALIIAPLIMHEPLLLGKLLAALTALIALAFGKGYDGFLGYLLSEGSLLAFLAAFFWALYALKTRHINFKHHFHHLFFLGAISAFFAHSFCESTVTPTLFEFSLLFLIGFLSNGINHLFWAHGMKKGNFHLLALLVYLTPLLSLIPLFILGLATITFELCLAFHVILFCTLFSHLLDERSKTCPL